MDLLSRVTKPEKSYKKKQMKSKDDGDDGGLAINWALPIRCPFYVCTSSFNNPIEVARWLNIKFISQFRHIALRFLVHLWLRLISSGDTFYPKLSCNHFTITSRIINSSIFQVVGVSSVVDNEWHDQKDFWAWNPIVAHCPQLHSINKIKDIAKGSYPFHFDYTEPNKDIWPQ